MSLEEEWRPVVGYEEFYEVSSKGRVRSKDRVTGAKNGYTRTVNGEILNPWLVEGYPRVSLSKRGQGHQKHVHRILAEAFIPNPDNHPLVRHLNDVRDDNRVENLAWGTVSDNEHDKVRNGNNTQANKTHCKRGHEFTAENTRRDINGHRQCRKCDWIRKNA